MGRSTPYGPSVMFAKANIHDFFKCNGPRKSWIPAYAGMTIIRRYLPLYRTAKTTPGPN
jgi:hypothetical protein